MSKVAIVTDSTAYIPQSIINELGITVVPLTVNWDGVSYLDGVDMKPEAFYQRLTTAKTMPSTSQPSPHAFLNAYQPLLDQGFDILSVHISSKLSGTTSSAVQAKDILVAENIAVIDSTVTGMALGYVAIHAAQAAQAGHSFESIQKSLKEDCDLSGAYFIVNTLEFLHRGGRIGGVAKFLGTALDLKPILTLKDGKIEAIEKVRTRSKSLERAINLFVEKCEGHQSVDVGIIHANAEADAHKVLEQIKSALPAGFVRDSLVTDVSPVIGTHAGPGTVGITFTLIK